MNWTVVLILALGTLIGLSKLFDDKEVVEDEVDEVEELERYIESKDKVLATIDNIYYSNVDAIIDMYHDSQKELDKIVKKFERDRRAKK